MRTNRPVRTKDYPILSKRFKTQLKYCLIDLMFRRGCFGKRFCPRKIQNARKFAEHVGVFCARDDCGLPLIAESSLFGLGPKTVVDDDFQIWKLLSQLDHIFGVPVVHQQIDNHAIRFEHFQVLDCNWAVKISVQLIVSKTIAFQVATFAVASVIFQEFIGG